jgi:acyl-CoA dehydrogenase
MPDDRARDKRYHLPMPWTPSSLLHALQPAAPRDWRVALGALEDEPPFSIAVLGGRGAGTIGEAFCFGYQAALRALLPGLMAGRLGALCATEAGGNHPRAIRTRLEDGRLTGEKAFVTLGPFADLLVVVASSGRDERGRNRLVACTVDPGAPGVGVTAMPPLPFVPDVPHGTLSMVGVRPERVLPGDGYTGLLKPFRTIEDTHVHAALGAWLVGVAVDAGWPDDLVEALLGIVATLGQVAAFDPSQPGTHRLLGGALANFDVLLERVEPLWSTAAPGVEQMWQRDRALMRIASGAREARLDSARRQHAE